jgi:hypothetical protein
MTVDVINERSEDKGFSENNLLLEVYEILFLSRYDSLVVLLVVFGHDKSILPDTITLVSPKSNNFHRLALELLRLRKHNVLHDLSEITHVEHVMEFLSSGSKLRVFAHISKTFLCSIDNLRSQFLDRFIEFREMIL